MTILAVANCVSDLTTVSGTITNDTTSGSFDASFVQNSLKSSGDNSYTLEHTAAVGDVTWYKLTYTRVSVSSDLSGTPPWLIIYDAAGNVLLNAAKASTTSSSFVFTAYGATNAVASSMTMSSGTNVFTIKVDVTGTGTVVSIYLGNEATLFTTLTVADRGAFGKPTKLYIRPSLISYYDSYNGYVSEIMVADASLIGMRLIALAPTAVGDVAEFAGAISTLTDGSAATGLVTDAAGQRHSWTLPTYSGTYGELEAFIIKGTAQRSEGTPTKLAPMLRIASVNYDGAETTISDTTKLQHVWDVNPATLATWNTSEFASIQGGIKSAA